MSPSPQDVISLYEECERLRQRAATEIQKGELRSQLQRQLDCVKWEVTISDVIDSGGGDFALKGTVAVDHRRWWGGTRVAHYFFTAYVYARKDLRTRLLTIAPGQRVLLEGALSFSACGGGSGFEGAFTMNPARLLE